ncbi:MAG: hypothetical protein ABIB79_04280 [archaeon]
MKMIITIKSEKKEPSKSELDNIVDVILDAGDLLNKKLKFREVKCHNMRNGSSLILKK